MIARNRDARVVDYIVQMEVYIGILIPQADSDQELESKEHFLNVLYSVKVRQEVTDKTVWHSSKKNGFQVKSYCQVLCSEGNRASYGKAYGKFELHHGFLSSLGLLLWENFDNR